MLWIVHSTQLILSYTMWMKYFRWRSIDRNRKFTLFSESQFSWIFFHNSKIRCRIGVGNVNAAQRWVFNDENILWTNRTATRRESDFFFVFRFLFCVLILSECMSVLSINVDVGSVRNKGHFSSVDDSHLIHRPQYTAELMSWETVHVRVCVCVWMCASVL